jgi:hypothetical protein
MCHQVPIRPRRQVSRITLARRKFLVDVFDHEWTIKLSLSRVAAHGPHQHTAYPFAADLPLFREPRYPALTRHDAAQRSDVGGYRA